jgi:hypothetical protein
MSSAYTLRLTAHSGSSARTARRRVFRTVVVYLIAIVAWYGTGMWHILSGDARRRTQGGGDDSSRDNYYDHLHPKWRDPRMRDGETNDQFEERLTQEREKIIRDKQLRRKLLEKEVDFEGQGEAITPES